MIDQPTREDRVAYTSACVDTTSFHFTKSSTVTLSTALGADSDASFGAGFITRPLVGIDLRALCRDSTACTARPSTPMRTTRKSGPVPAAHPERGRSAASDLPSASPQLRQGRREVPRLEVALALACTPRRAKMPYSAVEGS